ncbi:MAG: site-specific DNA-methyltransferase [Proteobacteria bacterium]|nr:MAG: site-specific DNA-methyltransferase [Pseudomonadota bacterium]
MTEKYKLQQDDINSMDLTSDTLARLKQILPEVFSEGADGKPSIDVERLKIVLGGAVDIESDDKTRYSFNWSGKKQVQALANQPSAATLRPCQADSKNWDTTQNVYIEGDNLEVLKLLQKSYYGQIKMIYIDPPYNTGKDFVYKDNFHDNVKNYLQLTGQLDDEGNRISTNTDKSGRYHTDWLNMMYPRLKLARNLLKDDGVIFISIDDNEVHNLRKICDEIFGEDNFVGDIIWEKRYGRSNDAKLMASVIDHIILYRKSDDLFMLRESRSEDADKKYSNPDNDPRGDWTSVSFVSQRTRDQRPKLSYKIKNPNNGVEFEHPTNSWKFSFEKYQELMRDNRFYWGKDGQQEYPRLKRFLSELSDGMVPVNLWKFQDSGTGDEGTKEVNELVGKDVFNYPKPTKLLKKLTDLALTFGYDVTNDYIILDFFSGSATTAHAVMQLNAEDGGNRKYICVQLPEATAPDSEAYKAGYKNICEIGKERIRRAGEKVLAEWVEKQQKSSQAISNAGLFADDAENSTIQNNLDIGFKVFKLDISNIKPFDANDMFASDLLVAGRSALDLFYELVLKQGYSLDNRQAVLDIGGTRCYALVHEDNTPFVLAVLDDKVKPNFALELLKYTLTLVIVKDECFSTDEIKLNLLATLEQLQCKDSPLQIRII